MLYEVITNYVTMKIAFDAKRAFLNRSGLGNYSRDVIRGLQQYFPENHYTLYTPAADTTLFEPNRQNTSRNNFV